MPTPQASDKKARESKSTQSSLLINEIKDGVVVMRDGSLRAVILASAINFDLMSAQEQDAVEFAYQGFLNSLHWPIQIVIKSQRIDLDGYIDKLTQLRDEQDNPLLGDLMDDYIYNIRGLLEEVNIMDKRFYVVVPFFPPLSVTKNNLASNLKSIFKPTNVVTVGQNEFEEYKRELTQRVQQVASGLVQMGIRAIPLNTQELIDLYYASYNPDVAVNEKLIDATDIQTASVTKGPRPGEEDYSEAQIVAVAEPVAPAVEPAVPTPHVSEPEPTVAPQPVVPTPAQPAPIAQPPVTPAPTPQPPAPAQPQQTVPQPPIQPPVAGYTEAPIYTAPHDDNQGGQS
jgi:hypothetical protein